MVLHRRMGGEREAEVVVRSSLVDFYYSLHGAVAVAKHVRCASGHVHTLPIYHMG